MGAKGRAERAGAPAGPRASRAEQANMGWAAREEERKGRRLLGRAWEGEERAEGGDALDWAASSGPGGAGWAKQ